MNTSFRERLANCAATNGSWLLVGLDPVVSQSPVGIAQDAQGVLAFNRRVIEATSDLVLGYKLNFGFYEAMGSAGWDVLQQTRQSIPSGLLTIADAKRGDVSNSSEMYAQAIFDSLGFDAITVSPYVGREGLQPFLDRRDRGSFVLCRTSNRDGTLQDQSLNGVPMFEYIATTVPDWGDNVGLVTGATDLPSVRRARECAPKTPLLMPGIGSQGGSISDAYEAGRDAHGGNALLSASRSVIYASHGSDFADAARTATKGLLEQIAVMV